MTKEHSLLGQVFFGGDPSRAEREEKVLRYIIHRIDEDAVLHEIQSKPELIHATRQHLEQTFRSGELDPRRYRILGK